MSAPTILVTPSHQFPGKLQDAMAVWIDDTSKEGFKLCLRETKIFDGLHQSIKIVSNLLTVVPCVRSPLVMMGNYHSVENTSPSCQLSLIKI